MSTAVAIETRISNYLDRLSPKQKQVVLKVVKTLAEDHETDYGSIAIPEEHKNLVRKRIKKYSKSPGLLMDWDKAQKLIRLD